MQTKFIAGGLLVAMLLWWLIPSNQQGEGSGAQALDTELAIANGALPLSSAIEPINIIDGGDAPADGIDYTQSVSAKRKFDQATEHILKQQWNDAIALLDGLIKEHPLAIEPYINLAVVYAQTDRLTKARETLTAGIKANSNYATLFENLQSIHGALAADAYRKVLQGDNLSNNLQALDLSLINSIDMAPIDRKRQTDLETQLRTLAKQGKDQKDIANEQESKLKAELNNLNLQMTELDAKYKSDIAVLESQISELNTVAQNQAAALVVAAAETKPSPPSSDVVAVNNLPATSKPADLSGTTAVSEMAAVSEATDTLEREGEKLVMGWANAWSNQDVDRYVSHYIQGYSPRYKKLSNDEWLAQRRERLTNKKFIKVDVSKFDVKDEGDKFIVTFTQHYQSNTMDDTIRKQLVFSANRDDLSSSKIIDERVVR